MPSHRDRGEPGGVDAGPSGVRQRPVSALAAERVREVASSRGTGYVDVRCQLHSDAPQARPSRPRCAMTRPSSTPAQNVLSAWRSAASNTTTRRMIRTATNATHGRNGSRRVRVPRDRPSGPRLTACPPSQFRRVGVLRQDPLCTAQLPGISPSGGLRWQELRNAGAFSGARVRGVLDPNVTGKKFPGSPTGRTAADDRSRISAR